MIEEHRFEVFYVAWCKNGKPQMLVGGPFVDLGLAQTFIDTRPDADRLEILESNVVCNRL